MATYDPKKKYRWNENDSFTFTGQEFASFYHHLTEEMNQIGGATTARKVEAYGVMMNKFIQWVQSGLIYEDKEEIPSSLAASEDPSVRNLFAQ